MTIFQYIKQLKPWLSHLHLNRNHYDRYWFNGFSEEKDFLFEIGVGFYPNRHIMDAHFSISTAGKQYSYHASKRMNPARYPINIGPISLEILEPMQKIRFSLNDPEKKLSCDLIFNAITEPHLEPKSLMIEGTRKILETSRFTQFGKWDGSIETESGNLDLTKEYGTRDKSWGVRPVGEPEIGAPGKLNAEPRSILVLDSNKFWRYFHSILELLKIMMEILRSSLQI